MKFSTSYSSPSSASSSSTLAFDSPMCTSKRATAGCLTAILRRILCSGGLPTHPSDQIRELDSVEAEKDQELKTQKNVEEAAAIVSFTTPGIVARLMGLDSVVERETRSSFSSLSRSRSMNSVDYLGEHNFSMQGLHKRVKPTLSFREVPPFVQLENENFFILSFENLRESKEFRSKGKTEMSSAELMLKRSEKQKLKEKRRENVSREMTQHEKEKLRIMDCHMSPRNVPSDGKLQEITNTLSQFKVSSENKYIEPESGKFSESIKHKEVLNSEKLKRRTKKKKKKINYSTEKKIELDCNSEESSPVSVLDFECKVHESDADSCEPGLNSRRKLSTKLENEQQFPLLFYGNLMVEERKIKSEIDNKKCDGSNLKRIEKHGHDEYMDIWSGVFRLVEDDLIGSEGIKAKIWKQSDCQSLCADFESEIFDHLLNEFIHQLIGHPLKTL